MLTKLGIGWMIGVLIIACQWWYYLLATDNHAMICGYALLYWVLFGVWAWNPFHIFANKENKHDRF